ncbi:MAG TPA: hypothetical protein VJ912_02625 [Candidatus Nanoarchaeia archaeon]|nr:hypothetical protein [Candidatus Nanoarchaeia archaeon]
MKSKKVFLVFVCFLTVILILNMLDASLGLTPAKRSLNFEPGSKSVFEYRVNTDNPEKELILYSKGNLSEYVSLNKEKLIGGGGFKATLSLPEKIEKPGRHRILIGVKEKIDKELATVGTSVAVQGVIYVHVPYPGRYIEINNFKAENANAGEPVRFSFELINRGKENLTIKPEIEIYSKNKKEETLNFKTRKLETGKNIKLKKDLQTQDYNPGEYYANLIVDYGNKTKEKTNFRLGTLKVDILNHTKSIKLEGVKRFDIKVESKWNNKIPNLYGIVTFYNESSVISKIKTPSSTIEPWEKKQISGFLDTKKFNEEEYKANITLKYSGNSTEKMSNVTFIKEDSLFTNPWIISIISAIIIVGGALIVIYLRKNKKKLKKENEGKN